MITNKIIKSIIFSGLSFFMVAAHANDALLKSTELTSPQQALFSINNHRETVQFSRAMTDTDFSKKSQTQPVKTESQEYWFRVSGNDLKQGVTLDTSGVEALIRISPKSMHDPRLPVAKQSAPSTNLAIDLEQLEITTPSGKVTKGIEAMSFHANSKQLETTPFEKGTSAFKIDKAYATGRYQLKTSQSIPDKQEYLIYVLDKNSPYKLNMTLDNQQLFSGQNMSAKIELKKSGITTNLESVSGNIVSPGGKVYPINLTASKSGAFKFEEPLDMPFANRAGLWEMRVVSETQGGSSTIKRNSKLAFAFQPKTARVNKKSKQASPSKAGLTNAVNISVSHAGRYEVTGVLYIVDRDGTAKSIAEARTAKWIEQGSDKVELLFQKSLLPALKRGQKFKVGNIGLNDQSRMTRLQ